ncbi:uncharacterized protein BX664DRAFT_327117 [Halteromyces radiatus]|uniref:uncharacterized protein n=1 Tax=Halteromyces radiatus TaxID=101107 RepID=UPI00221FB2B1|nr:uncharacterized protein BX664DRAFT_327117 [Halteromyces radiatus]KAI8097728.1 hypothetical protein BX664DRAFT_327117 [Halteromyces radiatus]
MTGSALPFALDDYTFLNPENLSICTKLGIDFDDEYPLFLQDGVEDPLTFNKSSSDIDEGCRGNSIPKTEHDEWTSGEKLDVYDNPFFEPKPLCQPTTEDQQRMIQLLAPQYEYALSEVKQKQKEIQQFENDSLLPLTVQLLHDYFDKPSDANTRLTYIVERKKFLVDLLRDNMTTFVLRSFIYKVNKFDCWV